jgi:hypothetical protein
MSFLCPCGKHFVDADRKAQVIALWRLGVAPMDMVREALDIDKGVGRIVRAE